jgi:hypothetical protein
MENSVSTGTSSWLLNQWSSEREHERLDATVGEFDLEQTVADSLGLADTRW